MKFLHTSDWHLGRQFHNVSLLDDQALILQQLVDYVRHHPVDAVIVAGDIYDRSVPPTQAIQLLNQVVSDLCQSLNTPVIMIPGNHDGAARLGFAAEQMKASGLYIISDFSQMLEPVVLSSELAGEVAFYGMPYNDPELVRHHFNVTVSTHDEAHQVLCEKIVAQFDTSQCHVLISHCFVDGAIESESERPLSIGGSDRVSHEHFLPFDYVALGHLHQPQYKGEAFIRYSGSLMKYSFSEQHQKKSMTLVELDKTGFVCATQIELHAAHEMRIIEGNLADILEQAADDPRPEDYLLIRLTDKHAILDPMEKLRQVYPNVLHIEKPGMLIGIDQEMSSQRLKRNEIDMFKDFFQEAKQEPLTREQEQAIATVIADLKKGEE
ncbi:exonuclease subunit SbcD [Vibrio sp. CAIM 722]|uniref:Nuclease SbcCD subunit D n=1 Tax=Vibrio eleionomae TaxID=2653505 RepID=A0A7X4RV47_9VIBR|nr:exonuclease SbcCD subunit D [Vibrio eleionomae]MZI93952.1 exonuclease subunit SbcD [Vibrio eleionomae]